MEAQIIKQATGSNSILNKVFINSLQLSKRVKTLFQKVNSTMEVLGSAAGYAIRN